MRSLQLSGEETVALSDSIIGERRAIQRDGCVCHVAIGVVHVRPSLRSGGGRDGSGTEIPAIASPFGVPAELASNTPFLFTSRNAMRTPYARCPVPPVFDKSKSAAAGGAPVSVNVKSTGKFP